MKVYRYRDADAMITVAENIRNATLITADSVELDLQFNKNAFRLPDEKVSLILLETE